MKDDAYEGREQGAAKHLMLKFYLEALAVKVGQFQPNTILNYIDGFAGPWQSRTDDLSDTSPGVALERLMGARDRIRHRSPRFRVRAFFVTTTREGAAQLERLRERFPDAEIDVVVGELEDRIADACRFARGGRDVFTFVFLDPTGWTGFGLRAIKPLLTVGRTEVLINFMTGHISRWIDNGPANLIPSFVELFGDATYRERWQKLEGLDREERMVETYCERVAAAGRYSHCVSAVVLKPTVDRTHYHLIYGTHSDVGLTTFREIEREFMRFQRTQRAELRQEKRVSKTNQFELFGAETHAASTYEDELRARYVTRAHHLLDQLLAEAGTVSWDAVLLKALHIPLVHEADVKRWLDERVTAGDLVVEGLTGRARVPRLRQGHMLRRLRT